MVPDTNRCSVNVSYYRYISLLIQVYELDGILCKSKKMRDIVEFYFVFVIYSPLYLNAKKIFFVSEIRSISIYNKSSNQPSITTVAVVISWGFQWPTLLTLLP